MDINKRLLYQIEQALAKRKQIEEEGRRGKEPNLKAISDALDDYYIYQKLKVYCAFLSYRLIINPQKIPYTDQDFHLLPAIVAQLNQTPSPNPAVLIYLSIKLLYEAAEKAPTDSYPLLGKCQQLIDHHLELFSKTEGIKLYSFLTNYCTWALNHPNLPRAKKEVFTQHYLIAANSIIQLEVDDKTKKIKQIPAQLYRNIVTVAINTGEDFFSKSTQLFLFPPIDTNHQKKEKWLWIEGFIEFFKKGLPETEKNPYYVYCRASVDFEQARYKQAYFSLKQSLHKQELFTTLSQRILYLKVLFELEIRDPDFLDEENISPEREADNYRNLVKYEKDKRQKMNYHLDYFYTFNKFYLKLVRLYHRLDGNTNPTNKTIKEKSDLLKDLSKVHHSYHEWFLRKLSEISN